MVNVGSIKVRTCGHLGLTQAFVEMYHETISVLKLGNRNSTF